MSAPAKLLADAQRAAGDCAVRCAEQGDHRHAREWSELAVTIGYCLRDAIKLLAAVGGDR